jgi:hypothetical protein
MNSEHVAEYVEGVNYQRLARVEDSGVWLMTPTGAFETRRACGGAGRRTGNPPCRFGVALNRFVAAGNAGSRGHERQAMSK